MSLVSTYVQANNKLWYKNPTCRGKDWFLCFDDPIELIIERGTNQFHSQKFRDKGFLISRIGNHVAKSFTKDFRQAEAIFLRWGVTDHDGSYLKRPDCQGVFYPADLSGVL